MPDSPQTEANPQNPQANEKNSAPLYWRRIFLYSFVAYIILLGLSLFWPNLAERTKFFTANGLVLALLIVAIAQVLIYYGQQQIMQGQLDEMKRQADFTKDSLGETRKIVEQNERAVAASEAQATTAQAMVEITREAFVTAERAYIGIQDVTMADFQLGSIPRVLIVLINAGKTPAWNIRSRTAVGLYTTPCTSSELKSVPLQIIARSLPANRTIELESDFVVTLNPEILSRVAAKTLKFFIRGEITFLDISNTEQTFPFCLAYRPAYGIFRDCRESEYPPDDKKPN
jgi:hypothetical protein